jgi:signal transduction histidine kinase
MVDPSMSAPAITSAELPRDSTLPTREPPKLRALEWSVGALTFVVLSVLATTQWGPTTHDGLSVVAWAVLLVIVDLAPVPYTDQMHITMSLPVLLAAGMVLAPTQVALVALLGSIDPRELKRRVSLARAVFNRSLIALCSLSASALFHGLGVPILSWPTVLLVAAVCVVVDATLNVILVSLAQAFASAGRFRLALKGLVGPSPLEFMSTYLIFGLGGLLIATADLRLGAWGLVASLILLAVARQMFTHRREANRAVQAIAEKDRALLAMAARIADERKDERTRVAASLHDEVLGGLYRIELSSEVLRQDLVHGRLLELEADLPQLTDATRGTAGAMRRIVRDLRSGPTAAGELDTTLRLLLDDTASRTRATLIQELDEIQAPPLVQLVLYQVAREALENAVRHSRASKIHVRLMMDEEDASAVRIVVIDDGAGFDLSAVDLGTHYGLQLMRERAEALGGVLLIESIPGAGTLVAARLPTGNGGDSDPTPRAEPKQRGPGL